MLINIKSKLKDRLNNNKGSMLIEYVIGLLMFVVFVAFAIDLIMVGHKHYYIGQEMANISRTLSVQSGIEEKAPNGFPGGNKSYQTSSQVLKRMDQIAKTAGFEDDEWEIYLEEKDSTGKVVRKGTLQDNTNLKAEYLNQISLEFHGTYKWSVLSAGVPGVDAERNLTIKRIAMAEYVRNYE